MTVGGGLWRPSATRTHKAAKLYQLLKVDERTKSHYEIGKYSQKVENVGMIVNALLKNNNAE